MVVEFEPIREDFGARVKGVDLSRPLSDETFASILDGFHRFGLLVFSGPEVPPELQVALARRFPNDGGLPPYKTYLLDGFPEITLLGNVDPPDGRSKAYLNKIGIEWHTDGTSHPRPMIATLLYAAEAPSEGGETLFLSGYTAWSCQPENVRRRCQDLQVRYNFGRLLERQSAINKVPLETLWQKWRDRVEPVAHPLVRRHPVTRRDALWVTWAEMEYVVGMAPEASLALVNELLDRATQPQFVYAHKWRAHDLVVWDNRCVLHTTTPVTYESDRRLMYRIGLNGDRAVS